MIELLVVIAIIAVLVALLLPAVQQARESARRSSCKANLKQFGTALANFEEQYGNYPLGMTDDDGRNFGWGTYLLPFMDQAPLMDNLVNGGLWQFVKGGQPLTDPTTQATINTDSYTARFETGSTLNPICKVVLSSYICPSDVLPEKDNDGFGKSNYCGNSGSYSGTANTDWTVCASGNLKSTVQNGVILYANDNSNVRVVATRDITDGVSNVIAIGEVTESLNVGLTITNSGQYPIWPGGNNNGGCAGFSNNGHLRLCGQTSLLNNPYAGLVFNINSWIVPVTTPATPMPQTSNGSFGSKHSGGAQFLFADGSVRFLSEVMNVRVYADLGGRNDNDISLQAQGYNQ